MCVSMSRDTGEIDLCLSIDLLFNQEKDHKCCLPWRPGPESSLTCRNTSSPAFCFWWWPRRISAECTASSTKLLRLLKGFSFFISLLLTLYIQLNKGWAVLGHSCMFYLFLWFNTSDSVKFCLNQVCRSRKPSKICRIAALKDQDCPPLN